MIFERFDTAVVPFPFAEQAVLKRRPVVVMSSRAFNTANGATLVAMITTAKASVWPSDIALTDLAALRLEAGDPAKAAELSAEACRLFSLMKRAGVMDLAGFDLQAHMLYALALQTLGEAQHGLNRAADSEEALRESIAICNRALAAGPGTRPGRYSPAAMAPSFRFLRARLLHSLSRTLAANPTRSAEAEDRATDAVEALDRLAEDAPKVEVYRKQRAASYRHRAALRLLGDKAKEAADDARKADEIDRLEAVPVRRDS